MKPSKVKPAKNLVGVTIRKIRLSLRTPVSQQDLSARLAANGVIIDQSAIARIERGERSVLDLEAVAIAGALKVPIERLFSKK